MAWQSEFEPKTITVLREGYSRQSFARDAMAGLVVGVVALPLAIAFAIASGVRPEQGLITAIFGGFLISALGGSRVQIGGPTGAFVVLIYAIVAEFGYDGLAVATMMAGVLLVIMGLARLGSVIRFIPYPVTVGFTSGIALIIASGQIPEALGLQLSNLPAEFLPRLNAYWAGARSVNLWALAVVIATIGITLLTTRLQLRIPGPLLALLTTTALVQLADIPVSTIQDSFGSVPSAIPVPHLPHVSGSTVASLVSPAISIALLGGIESLLSAVVADGMTGRRHRSNVELVAQGIANIVSPLFGGIPATGAIARTATNVKNGGRSPLAGIVHALTLLAILLFAGQWAALIPMATLAGILLVVAYNMSEWRLFIGLLRGPRSDVLVLIVTFLLTVLIDLTTAIQAGVVLASLLFMRRMAEVTQVRALRDTLEYGQGPEDPQALVHLPPGVEVFEIFGSFCFGATQKFLEVLGEIKHPPRLVILRMRDVFAIDATGLRALDEELKRLRRTGTTLMLSGVQPQVRTALDRSGLLDRLGPENVHPTLDSALRYAQESRLSE